MEKYVVVRVDNHLHEIMAEGDFDGCLEIWETLSKISPERIYIVRGKKYTEDCIKNGEIL
jgi:hypothetical protein